MNVVQGTPAAGKLDPAYTCQLTNTQADVKGVGHSVAVRCAFLKAALGGGIGTSLVTNAVVNITGR